MSSTTVKYAMLSLIVRLHPQNIILVSRTFVYMYIIIESAFVFEDGYKCVTAVKVKMLKFQTCLQN